MDSYMNQIAALFQDFMKYEMTLKENIGFGQIDKLHQTNKMHEVLDIVRADFLKSHSSYQFDTQLGLWFDEGRQLSGGQWQKIALARAYFREASCIFWTSQVLRWIQLQKKKPSILFSVCQKIK